MESAVSDGLRSQAPCKPAGASPGGVTLGELAAYLRECGVPCSIAGDPATRVTGVCDHSGRVQPGDLFVALPGHRTDGRRFAAEAISRGAAAVACSAKPVDAAVPAIVAADILRAAGPLAARVLGNPAGKLRLAGVTGTNGKTTVAFLLEGIARKAGITCGLAGTVFERWPGCERRASLTTVPAVALQTALGEMVRAGCQAAVLEVSSHALAQHRVGGCRFGLAVFTNLTRDHLDYHGDEESYFAAKQRLFTEYLAEGGAAVVNADDPWGRRLVASLPQAGLWTFSPSGARHARARLVALETSLEGTRARMEVDGRAVEVRSRLLGAFNAANLLAAATAALAWGIELDAVTGGLESCGPVPGRLERIGTGRPVVLVDYAHTPDALERALAAVSALAPGRTIVCFGCGGDRDRGKRPMMGAAAARGADVVVLTSDNPRSEDPERIIADIEAGLAAVMERIEPAQAAAGRRGYLIEPDRREAIRTAIEVAADGDVVLVAGKGHEDYQEVRGERRPFDDRAVVRELLEGQ